MTVAKLSSNGPMKVASDTLLSRFSKQWAMDVLAPSNARAPPATRASMASSARTPSDSTESMCRPSDMRPTAPSIVQGFMNLPARCWESRADRGVFITTSRFSPGAISEAERINARIELIDGARLAELLVRHRVGVQTVQTVDLYRLDEDFFDEL
jgi:Restriction endonuclease